MPGSSTTPGHMGTRAVVPIRVAFRLQNGVGARNEGLSRLDGWPMHTPADASPAPPQVPAHGSGPMRFATPSSWRTFTAYSLPVSPAHSAVPPIPDITATDRSTYALCQEETHAAQQSLYTGCSPAICPYGLVSPKNLGQFLRGTELFAHKATRAA
jgi:hypothetical protein